MVKSLASKAVELLRQEQHVSTSEQVMAVVRYVCADAKNAGARGGEDIIAREVYDLVMLKLNPAR